MSASLPRLHVLVNPSATRVSAMGEIESAYEPLRDEIADLHVEPCDDGADLAPRAREAAQGGATVVVGAGGDGTLSAVASSLAGGDVPLGILPVGRHNHFAKDAGIPLDLPSAAAATIRGTVRRMDLGDASGRPFLNNASIGVYFDVVTTRERWRPRVGRPLASLIGMAHALRHPPLLKLEVTSEGRMLRARFPIVWVGNNRYGLHWPETGSRTRLDEGLLTLVLVHETSRWAFARQVVSVLLGRSHLAQDIDVSHPGEVAISSASGHLRIALDGERMSLPAPLRIFVRREALGVVVPASPEAHPAAPSQAGTGARSATRQSSASLSLGSPAEAASSAPAAALSSMEAAMSAHGESK